MDDDNGADDQLYPIWLETPRGFVDKRIEEAAAFNDLLTQHLGSSVETWSCDQSGWTFNLEDAVIKVLNNNLGSYSVTVTSERMPRKFLDAMRVELRRILHEPFGLDWSPPQFAVTMLQLVEEAESWRQTWKTDMSRWMAKDWPSSSAHKLRHGHFEAWDARKIRDWTSIFDNPYGVNLSTVEDTAKHLLGESIADICSRISKNLRILHVEPVFRVDLAKGFLRQRNQILRHLLSMSHRALRQCVSPNVVRYGSAVDTKDNLAHELSQPNVTFHGAPSRVVESIVRYGFVVPGAEIGDSGKILEVRCGSLYGGGIYSSPDPMYASCYLDYQNRKPGDITRPSDVPGMRLIVCATLMGRPIRVRAGEAWGRNEPLSSEAHSHVSPSGYQYIVFNRRQIIPCYVLHLDYGAEQAKAEFETIAANPEDYFQRHSKQRTVNKWSTGPETCPGDIQRKKQALKAAAAKWFPYGYGPARGTSFVIEDVADVSDDEETFGSSNTSESSSKVRSEIGPQMKAEAGLINTNWSETPIRLWRPNEGHVAFHLAIDVLLYGRDLARAAYELVLTVLQIRSL